MKKSISYLLIIASFFLSIFSFSQAGSLDPSFGKGGRTVTNFSETIPLYRAARAVAVQPDGKMVTVGIVGVKTPYSLQSGIFRFNQDGSPDTSFDHDGLAIIGLGPIFTARSVAIQADAKIVVAGTINYPFGMPNFALARYNADGSVDSSFDGDGILTTSIGDYDEAHSLAIQADGKIVVAGYSIGQFSPGVTNVIAIVRYNNDGSRDISFDGDGIVTTISGTSSSANSVAIQADDKILVAGQSDNGFMVARYNTEGSLDKSFDGDGITTTVIGVNSLANSIAIQPDGRIVLAGNSDFGGQLSFALARYETDGSLDNSFDADGILTTAIGTSSSANSMALQTDGRIIVAGTSIIGNLTTFAMSRYNIDGALDINFNNNGILTTVIGSSSAGNSLAIQNDGKILVAGSSTTVTQETIFAMLRYNTNGTLDKGFDEDGIIMDFGYSNEKANSMVIQTDGKIVMAGVSYTEPLPNYNYSSAFFFAITRHNTDGSLDNSFDADGKLTFPTNTKVNYGGANAVTIQKDGKIVIAGGSFASGNDGFVVARFNKDGGLDNSFDGDGIVTTRIGGFDIAQSVAIQADGKIVVGGGTSSINSVSAMVRYNTDGSLDSSFDGDGKLPDIFGHPSLVNAISIQVDGKILLAGSGPDGFSIARLNPNGSLDNSFNGDGKLNILFGSLYDVANEIAIQTDGRILIAGESYNGSFYDFAMARLNTDGSLDNSFNEDGKAIVTVGSSNRLNSSVGIQSDGRIVVSFNTYNSINSLLEQAVLMRYNSDGTVDQNFGNDGKVVTVSLAGTSEHIASVKISGNRIYVGGYSNSEKTRSDFFVAAYLVESTVEVSCPADKTVQAEAGQCQAVVNDIDPVVSPAGNNAIVNYTLSGATSTTGTGSASGQSFNKGVTTVTYSIDGELEKTCSFTVTVNPIPEICNNGKDDDCDGLVDEDCRRLPKIYITNTAVREGNNGTRHAIFELGLSKPGDKPITVEYHTTDRTAQAPGDYEQKSGTVTFPPGTRTKRILIKVKGDRLHEANERFSVVLSDAVNGVIRDDRAVCTIIDDDPVPAINIHDAVTKENCGQVLVRVSLNESSDQVITVRYFTKNGSAQTPGDYTAISHGILVFEPGETTKNISIVVNQDAQCEPTEKFYVLLRQAENAELNCKEAEVRIINSDPENRLMTKGAAVAQPATDENRMIVSPNPANQAVNLRLFNKMVSGKITVEMMDQNGRIVKQWIRSYDSDGQSINLPVADIPGGVYLVVIKDGKGKRLQQQVVVQH